MPRRSFAVAVAGAVIAPFLVLAPAPSIAQPKTEAPSSNLQPAYVGAETCQGCHPEQYSTYASSIHAKRKIAGSPATANACESCHGAGADHVSQGGGRGVGGIVAFDKRGDARAQSAKCLACHEVSRQVAFWELGAHKRNVVACSACHGIHTVATKKLKTAEAEVCFACHRDIKAQFNKQSHHPVKEGLITCSNCHEVHGGFGRRLVKADVVNELCYGCHPERRGPFLWEHPPVAENCLNCHQPHGSSHGRLLDRKVPQVCQSCHDFSGGGHPTEAYTRLHGFGGNATADMNKFFGRSCVKCHTNIHGSNGPGMAGSHFIR